VVSVKNRVIFGSLSWPAEITLFSSVIFVEATENYLAAKITRGLVSAAYT
jgi:hypothetical protein